MLETAKKYLYYILIGIVSFLALAILPMIGSTADVGWGFPQTPAAWGVWALSRIAASVLNVLIYHCFIRQGDLNTQNNESRKKAEEMLNKMAKKEKQPISPGKFFAQQYISKVPMVALTTFLSLVAIGPAILTFDITIFVSYIVSVTISIVFGILEMKRVEEYYTHGLLAYAEWLEFNKKEKEDA